MATKISQETIDELTSFLNKFSTNKEGRMRVATLSYDEAISHFFQNMNDRRLAEETLRFYRGHLAAFEKYLILIKKKNVLHEVTEGDIRHYLDTRYSKRNPYTQNANIRAIRAFFNYLERDGYLLTNPVSHLKLLKERKKKIEYLSHKQIRKLLLSFDLRNKSEIRNLLIIMLLLDTGVRVNELCRIKIEDVDFTNRSIYIYATKTHTYRTVYYSKETERILKVYRREILRSKTNGPLLLSFHHYLDEPTDEGMQTARVQAMMRKRGKRLFGEDFRLHPHKLRHTFATHFVINGGDPFSLKELLGHTNIETTNIYVDLNPRDLKIKHEGHGIFSSVSKNDKKVGVYNED